MMILALVIAYLWVGIALARVVYRDSEDASLAVFCALFLPIGVIAALMVWADGPSGQRVGARIRKFLGGEDA